MKIRCTAASLTLAAATILAACGGGEGSDLTASEQKANSPAQAVAAEPEAIDLTANTESMNSSDAYVLTADDAQKLPETASAIVKSVPTASLNTAAQTNTIDLGAPPAAELEQRERNNQRHVGTATAKAYQTGIGRTIAATSQTKSFQQALTWSQLANGNTNGTARFSSTDAHGIRLGVLIASLPDNAVVRVSATDADTALEIKGSAINQAIAANVAADGDTANARTYWLPMTTGSTTDLAIELPAGVSADQVAISVPSLVHMLESAPQAALTSASQKSVCTSQIPDPVCNTPLPPVANAVSAFTYMEGGDSYSCTGTLLADKAASGTPYFLTANHCINSQTVATSMINLWFYRSSGCDNGILNPDYKVTFGGAKLLWHRSDATNTTRNPVGTDTSFLKLNTTPPAGAMFAGWTVQPQAVSNSVTLTGFHHPNGDLLRQSTGTISNMAVYLTYRGLAATSDTSQPMYQTSWSAGITESGSSGSGLFLNGTTANPQMVGQLWGGLSSCTAPTDPDFYGRFDLAYQDGLIKWLNPGYRMVFRFYNLSNGSHFFSANVDERNQVRNTVPSLQHEGPAFAVAPAAGSGLSPVYRFLNQSTNVHFYTINETEKAAVLNMPTFQYEGIAWYARQASSPAAGTIEVYRFSRLATGTHLYTTSVAERDSIIANLAGSYSYEGVAYLAWPVN